MYTGIIPALLTPFSSCGQVDKNALSALANYFIDYGVSGLYICGSTGEGLLLTEEERKVVAECIVAEVDGRVPVIVHVGAPATMMAEQLAKHAGEIGADAVASIPPMYYKVGRAEVETYYRKIKQAAELPLFFYNIPDLLNVSLDTQMAQILFEEGIIQGMKYTHHDVLTFRGIVEACDGKLNVFSGPDERLLNFLVMGAHGGIGTTYNCMPKLFVNLYTAWKSGEIEKAQKLQYKANRIISVMAPYNMIPAVKAVMQMQGLDCGAPRGPFLPLTQEQKTQLKGELEAVGFFDQDEDSVK